MLFLVFLKIIGFNLILIYKYLPGIFAFINAFVLFALMKSYPDKQLIVLCGHTHGDGMIDLLPNLSVYTGGARYKYPSIQKIFEIG